MGPQQSPEGGTLGYVEAEERWGHRRDVGNGVVASVVQVMLVVPRGMGQKG